MCTLRVDFLGSVWFVVFKCYCFRSLLVRRSSRQDSPPEYTCITTDIIYSEFEWKYRHYATYVDALPRLSPHAMHNYTSLLHSYALQKCPDLWGEPVISLLNGRRNNIKISGANTTPLSPLRTFMDSNINWESATYVYHTRTFLKETFIATESFFFM